MSLVAWSGQLLLQKKNHHPRSTVTCPRFSRFFFQKNNNQEHSLTHSDAHTQTHSRVHSRTHPDMHTHSRDAHTHKHTHPHSHPLTHTHTHPQEAGRLLGRPVSPRLAFEGSAKEMMVRLPKGRSSRILPPLGASGLMYSEDQSQGSEMEVLRLQGLVNRGWTAHPAGLAEPALPHRLRH